MAEVMLGGVWLHSLGNVSDVKWSSVWGAGACGADTASCSLAVDPSNDVTLLRLAKTFDVFEGGVKVFGGVVSEMGREFPRQISAKGLGRLAENFDAVDPTGAPTTNPRKGATQAVADGWIVTNPNAFPDITLGTEGGATTTRLPSVLNQWGTTAVERWGADNYGVLFTAAEPTTPTYYLDASDLPLGVADDGLYTRIRARYVSSVDTGGEPNGWASVPLDDDAAMGEYGSIWYTMDLTPLGLLTGGAPTAAAYGQAQLDLLTVPQWTSRVDTTSDRLLTPGGLPAYLPGVRAGDVVRLFNVPGSLGGLRGELGLDVVLGEVSYDTTSPRQIGIGPVGIAVRNLADVASQAKTAAEKVA